MKRRKRVLNLKTIIIDAGHGGVDPGAVAFGVKEKDWNLKMSLYQYDRLKELGAKIALTRLNDTTLESNPRSNLIKNKYDICISNHFNAFNGEARGIETIYSIFSDGRFAKNLAEAIRKQTGLPLRRVFTKKNSQGTDWYFMHRLTGTTKTVIIEYGFLDNVNDFNYYKNDQNFYAVAEVVVEEICKEIGISYRKKTNSSRVKSPQTQKLYRVQTGAFSKKENAIKQLEALKKAGFDGLITN